MKKLFIAAIAAAALSTSFASTPALAHKPASLWYKGQLYYLSNTYWRGYCFYHHGWIYCRPRGGY